MFSARYEQPDPISPPNERPGLTGGEGGGVDQSDEELEYSRHFAIPAHPPSRALPSLLILGLFTHLLRVLFFFSTEPSFPSHVIRDYAQIAR